MLPILVFQGSAPEPSAGRGGPGPAASDAATQRLSSGAAPRALWRGVQASTEHSVGFTPSQGPFKDIQGPRHLCPHHTKHIQMHSHPTCKVIYIQTTYKWSGSRLADVLFCSHLLKYLSFHFAIFSFYFETNNIFPCFTHSP